MMSCSRVSTIYPSPAREVLRELNPPAEHGDTPYFCAIFLLPGLAEKLFIMNVLTLRLGYI